MSEDMVARSAAPFGRLSYFSLGATTLAQLRRSRYIRTKLAAAEEQRKPDGIVFLPMAGIKAVVEVKTSADLTAAKLPGVVAKYAPIARAVCSLLIITDGKKTFWYNAHTEREVLRDGKPVRDVFDPAKANNEKLPREVLNELVHLIELCDQSLTNDNDHLLAPAHIDAGPLARSVWQKIWVNTGKEPEKCLYNVVEILLFKFLSDIAVLDGNPSFKRVVHLLATEGAATALQHYAQISRPRIRELFPASATDQTTVINGTIFVNEKGEANQAQAQLFGEVVRAFQDFDDSVGSLRYIDRQFKTRLYETFLRQHAGVRSLGQYFTPRNVVQSIVRMSNASSLKAGSSVCDPFCGVGGFLLETIVENPHLLAQFEPVDGKVRPQVSFRGYDKGSDEHEDARTIILAKANMLVYLSDLLAQYNSEEYLREFAEHGFNDVFHLLRSNLGTFELVDPAEQYDLILTNPPYVTSGSASIRSALDSAGVGAHYTAGGRGTEALATQWVVDHLKPGGQAFVIVPDGLLNQAPVLEYIKRECHVRAVVALPSRTFYATPKKTYILAVEKKANPQDIQDSPVFTFLVSDVGESRDARRVPIEANDLPELELQYGYFSSNPDRFTSDNPRVKIIAPDEFDALGNWLVDRRWTSEEKVALGVIDEEFEVDAEGLRRLVEEAQGALSGLLKELS